MAKSGYSPKKNDQNTCMVKLPETKLGRATRASLHSLILQIESKFLPEDLLSITYEGSAITAIREVSTTKNTFTSGELLQRLKKLEKDFSKHLNERVQLTIVEQVITATYKPNIKIVPQTTNVIERLILIDGSNVLTTAYHATKKNMLQSEEGLYTNAVYVMAQKIMDIISRTKPTHLAIAWDKGRENTFRRKLYPEYKAHRGDSDPELKQQFITAQKLFNDIGITQFMHEEIEADDAIGTVNEMWRKEKENAVVGIVSNDKDLFQLLSAHTSQLISKNGKEYKITPNHLLVKWNVTPEQWADCKALLGDKTDNIPGCPGVGEKAAYPLIAIYGNLETVIEKTEEIRNSEFKRYALKIEEGKEIALLSKQLATIKCDAQEFLNITSLDDLKVSLNKNKVLHHFKSLGFRALIQSIEKGMYKIG